jgi:hypothetical protein
MDAASPVQRGRIIGCSANFERFLEHAQARD